MYIKPYKNGKFVVMPDCAIFDNWALANDYIKTKKSDATVVSSFYGFDISDYKGKQRKDRIARNCVHPETGRFILDRALNIVSSTKNTQTALF